jgi:hypothetical protein
MEVDTDVDVDVEERNDELPTLESSGGGGGWGLCLLRSFLNERAGVVLGLLPSGGV